MPCASNITRTRTSCAGKGLYTTQPRDTPTTRAQHTRHSALSLLHADPSKLAVVGVRTGRCERRRHPCRPRRAGRAQPTWRQAHHQAPRRCGAAVRAVVRGWAAGSAERWTPGLPKFECAARAAQALTGRRSAALNRNRLQRRPRTPSWLATDRWPETCHVLGGFIFVVQSTGLPPSFLLVSCSLWRLVSPSGPVAPPLGAAPGLPARPCG